MTDTSTSQGLKAAATQTVTVTGAGFGSTTLADYVMTFAGTGCSGSLTGLNAASWVSDTELTVVVDLTACTGAITVDLDYKSQGALGAIGMGTIGKCIPVGRFCVVSSISLPLCAPSLQLL